MVNDKMVNGFMKKQYIFPLTEVMNFSTELMHLNSPSTTEFPDGPGSITLPSPKHRTEVF